MKPAKIMSFEQFAAQNGASRHRLGDVSLHGPAGHMPRRTWESIIRAQAARDADLIARRTELRAEYLDLVACGDIIEPSADQRYAEVAQGDGRAADAARRILTKKADRRAVLLPAPPAEGGE